MGHVETRLLALALGAISVLTFPVAVFAQAEWLSPTLGQAMFRGDVRNLLPRRAGEGNRGPRLEHPRVTRLSSFDRAALAELRATSCQSLEAHASRTSIPILAVLPATGVPPSRRRWDGGVRADVSPQVRQWLDCGRVNVAVGSAQRSALCPAWTRSPSAAPPSSPSPARRAQCLALHPELHQLFGFPGRPADSRDRLCCTRLRIGGPAFGSFGFRSTSMEWRTHRQAYRPAHRLMPVRTVRGPGDVSSCFSHLRVYAGFDWDNDWYLRAGRHRERINRLFYYEKRPDRADVRFDLRHVGFRGVRADTPSTGSISRGDQLQ